MFFGILCLLCLAAVFISSPLAVVQGQSLIATQSSGGGTGPTLAPNITKQRVTFQSDGLTLIGYLYKPQGNGPFPGIIWNHGSEKSPGTGPEFDAIADIFVPAGYVVFAPVRRGHGDSQGEYIDDQIATEKQQHGADAAAQLLVTLMEGPQLDDQLAGFAYLKALNYVDPNRLAVVGCSYGGIQTLLGAQHNPGYKAAACESPQSTKRLACTPGGSAHAAARSANPWSSARKHSVNRYRFS